MTQHAVVGVSRSPLVPIRSDDTRYVPAGSILRELRPSPAAFMCRLNGQWILEADWDRPVMERDVVEWYEVPQDRDTLRTVLQIVVTVVAAIVGGPAGAFIAAFGNFAIAVLLPVEPEQEFESRVSPTYATGIQGNKARLFEPVPKVCGRHIIYPPYAAQPYYRYSPYGTDAEGKETGGDQFFYALYAIGIGNHRIERAQLDDTDLTHFQDVVTSRYLPPGTAPSEVSPVVITSPEVTGQELLSSIYVGGFVACSARLKTKRIEYDLACMAGLGHVENNGSFTPLSINLRVEWREIDEFGSAVSLWAVKETRTLTGATRQPRRWTFELTWDTPVRPEIRIVRTDLKSDNDRFKHSITWAGMRTFLDVAAPLNPNVAHYELVLRASEQLSQISQGRFNVIAWAQAQRLVGVEEDGAPIFSGAETDTRNAADWIAELARSTVWGLGFPDERIDYASLWELSQIWDERQDRFDYVFDTSTDAWTALQLVARSGRARVFRRGGVLTIARDHWDTMPVTAFTHSNAQRMVMDEILPGVQEPDGLIVEYFDNRAWKFMPIECPAPGVTEMVRPERVRLPGVTGPKHAKREGMYEAAVRALRRRACTWQTEMEGILPAYMSVVRFLPDIPGYGQTGDITDYDGALLVTLSEPVNWVEGAEMAISVRGPHGRFSDPVLITPGPMTDQVYLAAIPSEPIEDFDSGVKERPTFVLGPIHRTDELVKITNIGDGGKTEGGAQLISMAGVIDDIRIHQADNAWLPAPGETQDPINPADEPDDPNAGGGGDVAPIPRLTGQFLLDPYLNDVVAIRIEFRNNGELWVGRRVPIRQGSTWFWTKQIAQWMLRPPIELETASRYEVRWTIARFQGGSPVSTDGVQDPGETLILTPEKQGQWLPLSTAQVFGYDLWDPGFSQGFQFFYFGDWMFEIREVATGVIQAAGVYNVGLVYEDGGGDGS
jgi:hypothetical protein